MTRSILIYRIGSLGDTLVAVPAIRAVRAVYRDARLTLLADHQIGQSHVLASDLLGSTGLIDQFLHYPVDATRRGRVLRPWRMARLLVELRRTRFDALVYLAPSNRAPSSVARDRRFFRAAGIRRLLGFEGFRSVAARPPGGFAEVPREADLLLGRLERDGVDVPAHGTADPSIPFGWREGDELAHWLATVPPDGGRRWVSVGPGGKHPLNRWPLERLDQVVRELIRRYDVWPVVFGGLEDLDDARTLIAACERGWVAAGALSLQAAILAMGRCALHVGNDTGTIHMAAAARTPCVGIYSSRNLPGLWYPYGRGHRILRTPIDCENCELSVCEERKRVCILTIDASAVVAACEEILSRAHRAR